MRVLRLNIRNFRGLLDVTMYPNGHVVLVGEPRAGRSTVVEALRRVLTPEATRVPLNDDLDFYRRDRSKRIEIEVVLGDLGAVFEQEFFDQLEPWDPESDDVVTETPDPTTLDEEDIELAVRLCYRAQWNDEAELADHWVDFPKLSDVALGQFARVPRRLLRELPVVFVGASSRPLGFGPRSEFRQLVEGTEGEDFAAALEDLLTQLEAGAEAFSETDQVSAALDTVLEPVRRSLGLGTRVASDIVRFLPEGGSLAGILRSLGPSLAISRSLPLPVSRHGSTASGLLRLAEALALGGDGSAIAIVDDFGDNVDLLAASDLAATYRSSFRQVWLSTRRGSAAEVFRPDELVRLIRPRRNTPRVHQGETPTSRSDRVAARHLAIQLLPAISARTVAVLEGPHDRAGLTAVAARRLKRSGEPLPAADGVVLVDAGAADRSGGAGAAVKLARFAAEYGFRVVVVLDGDRAGNEAQPEAVTIAHAVIRLPERHAIERVLVGGMEDSDLRRALDRLATGFGAMVPDEAATASGDALQRIAIGVIKSGGGFHAQFVELLPARIVPPLAAQVLDAIRDAARGRASGVVVL